MRVMIELCHSKKLQSYREFTAMSPMAGLDKSVVPKMDWCRADEGFAAVEMLRMEADRRPPKNFRESSPRVLVDRRRDRATYIVRGEIDDVPAEHVEKWVRNTPDVVRVYSDPEVQPGLVCFGDPPRGNASDVERLLGVDAMQGCGMDGSGVLVAVVDDGINIDHLRSQGKAPRLDAARSWSAVGNGVPGRFPVSHGTMVAYDVAIAAPNCTLLDIAYMRERGNGYISDAISAFEHLLNIMHQNARTNEFKALVVNNSWGMYNPAADFPSHNSGNYSDNMNHPFNRIVSTLEAAGADILFAAGNCGGDCPAGDCSGAVDEIGGANSHPKVLSVAGVDITEQRAGYSNRGPGRLHLRKPDIAGYTHFEGSRVFGSTDSGTSAACPVVAGCVAAVRSRIAHVPDDPERSPAAIRNLMTKSAKDKGALAYNSSFGWGVVNGPGLVRRVMESERDSAAVRPPEVVERPSDSATARSRCRCAERCVCETETAQC